MTEQMNLWKEFGGKLSVCRQNKNMTQEILAGKVGVTPQALSKWERGLSLPDISMLADLSQLLEVSVDWLLGVEPKKAEEDKDSDLQQHIGNCLRNSLEALELRFGVGLTSLFVQSNGYVEMIPKLRGNLAKQGILMPIVRIQDDVQLGEREFVVLAYHNVLYSETVENPDEKTMGYMIDKLGTCVREKYYEIINPDIVKSLVDNLKIKYPALIDGVVPEKISYGFLTAILKKHLQYGNSALYLPKVIEIADCELRENPNLTAEEAAEKIAQTIGRPDNIWRVLKARVQKTKE